MYPLTLQGMVRWEQSRGCVNSNTWTYVSGSRTALRLMWFCDFIAALITGLLDSDAAPLDECARAAYASALEPHHTWVVQNVIRGAMFFLPSRKQFFASLGEGDEDAALLLQTRLLTFLALVTPVREALWKFYRANGLQDLP